MGSGLSAAPYPGKGTSPHFAPAFLPVLRKQQPQDAETPVAPTSRLQAHSLGSAGHQGPVPLPAVVQGDLALGNSTTSDPGEEDTRLSAEGALPLGPGTQLWGLIGFEEGLGDPRPQPHRKNGYWC